MRMRGSISSAALMGLLALPLSALAVHADTASPFDATNLSGGCAALELTVATGYSFVVQPDIQVPRAAATVEEGRSDALASPVDPGDSVDALAGLGIPEAQGYIVNGYPGAPSPFAGQGVGTLPAPLNSVGTAIVENPFTQTLTYPYEHAEAGYPNAQRPGPQSATLAGTPNVTVADPSGLLAVDGTTAQAVAGDGYATADGGAGAAAAATVPATPLGVASVPALGLSVGRVSAHSEAHVLATKVTDDATCTLHDVEVAVPGSAALHIGAVVATAHTERALGAPNAVSSESIEFSGVTVNGQGATLDQNGLTVAGHHLADLPSASTPPPPPGLPQPPGPVSAVPPSVAVTGSSISQKQPTPDEATVAATGATVTINSTTPLPNGVPPTGISNTPTVYTLHIASLASEAYALPAGHSSGVGLGDVATGVAAVLGGGLGAFSPPSTAAGADQTHPGTSGQPDTLASIVVTPVQRGIILAVSSLLEGLLLVMIARNQIRARRRITPPAQTTDLP